ncbi:MAG: Type 1 glutamine amidotransferase-like domain-containing protein [Pirellula sp.]
MSYKVAGSSLRAFLVICMLLIPKWSFCQDLDEKFDHWPIDLGIRGTLGIAREQSSLSSLIDRIELGDPRSIMILVNGQEDEINLETLRRLGSKPTQDIDGQVNLDSAINTIFWLDHRSPDAIPAETVSRFQNYATKILGRGGSVFVCGPHADLLGHNYVFKHIDEQNIARKGLNLFPDCILDLAYSSTNESEGGLLNILENYPKCVGVGVEADTWLLLENRQMRVIGKGSGTLFLSPGTYPSARKHIIRDERPKIKEFDKVLVDLTQWRREAIDRTLPPFPPKETLQPNVPNGSLLIVGGGGMPANLMNRFIELAGGADQAKLVYVPCEEREQVSEEQSTVELWKRMGVKDATFIHTKDRNRANEDVAILEPLKRATGIWFGGGRQWNLADSYYGTRAHQLMKQCLERGGVIGGSSAGASIQASYLARATPIENFQIMAPGYERGGLGFIKGVAIDQHFSQRNRLPDLTQLVHSYPQLLGIGIDESTAIEVSGSVAHVSGRGNVFFVDGAKLQTDGTPSVSKLQQGSKYDLSKREPVVP